jgi:hypothetical protein
LNEFDVMDKTTGEFLSTARRRELLCDLPVVAAPVVWTGHLKSAKRFESLIGASRFQTARWIERLTSVCHEKKFDLVRVLDQTDQSGLIEGLYLKVEEEGRVVERCKFVRPGYTQTVEDSDRHWHDRPVLPNQLRKGVDIFAKQP